MNIINYKFSNYPIGYRNITTGVRLKCVGENPLNGNGTHPKLDEDIVCSHMKV